MENIKVSIISPIYNVPEKLLRNNIEHLIKQTLKEIEIILVDDGSIDNSGKICDEYAKKDKRIQVIHQNNKGLCGARNTGVLKARGRYIMFIDGDDWIENDTCEFMYNSCNGNLYDVVNACMMKDYGNKVMQYNYSSFEDKKIYKNEECEFWQEKVLDFKANISSVNAKLIKREILIKNNIIHNEKLKQGAEGLEFLIRLFEKTKSILFLNKYVYHYMYNNKSITENHNEKNHYMVLNCFKEIKKVIDKSNNKEKLLKQFYERMQYVIITTAISGFFSPSNNESFYIARTKYKKYLSDRLIKETLEKAKTNNISKDRKITFFLIKHNMFFMVKIIAYCRAIQKKTRR